MFHHRLLFHAFTVWTVQNVLAKRCVQFLHFLLLTSAEVHSGVSGLCYLILPLRRDISRLTLIQILLVVLLLTLIVLDVKLVPELVPLHIELLLPNIFRSPKHVLEAVTLQCVLLVLIVPQCVVPKLHRVPLECRTVLQLVTIHRVSLLNRVTLHLVLKLGGVLLLRKPKLTEVPDFLFPGLLSRTSSLETVLQQIPLPLAFLLFVSQASFVLILIRRCIGRIRRTLSSA